MSEPTVTPAAPAAPVPTAPAAPVTPTATPPAAPPWGTDFDAEKAWNLVQNLRADKENLAKRQVLTPEQQAKLSQFEALEEASKSDAQRLADATAQAQREAQEARDETTRYKVAAAHQIPVEHFDLLGKGTEEEITARAVKVSELLKAQAALAAPVTPPATRPLETLRPGATPAEAQTADDLVMERLFGKGH